MCVGRFVGDDTLSPLHEERGNTRLEVPPPHFVVVELHYSGAFVTSPLFRNVRNVLNHIDDFMYTRRSGLTNIRVHSLIINQKH